MSRAFLLIPTLGSIALLGGALLFQYVGGLAPCQMCLWQRWPHAIAIGAGILALLFPGARLPLAGLAALAIAIGIAIAVFHAGVEWDWWEGLTSCSGSGSALSGMTGSDLLSQDGPLGVVRCDEAAWVFLGLSMAGWNAVFSLFLFGFWMRAVRTA
ncbi:disulfide bond formation protein B [Roseobacter sp. HKCCA0434]|uniref:disulfide bond formation protein B n=1 Tax=Roseobacter sp. HKCCA0434 TaxID=3079297 RepID=UPI002905D5EB|nr:disulfide bond formation protein B [Roseobacter sp. HKCCA0434]